MTSRNSPDPHSGGPPPNFPFRPGPEYHRRLKLYAAMSGQSMNDVVLAAVRRFLDEPNRKAMLDKAMPDFPETDGHSG